MIKNRQAIYISFVILILIASAVIWHYIKPISVVIQAGHEGRTIGNTGSHLGRIKEVDWNILVANEVAKKLKSWGISVVRVGADPKPMKAKIAVAIHFDGSSSVCKSGASIGYKDNVSKTLAKRWEKIYRPYFPFNWQQNNFTKNLKDYYAYKIIDAKKFIVLELGEISCKKQVKWLKPRLKIIAHLIAATIAKEFGYDPYIKLK